MRSLTAEAPKPTSGAYGGKRCLSFDRGLPWFPLTLSAGTERYRALEQLERETHPPASMEVRPLSVEALGLSGR